MSSNPTIIYTKTDEAPMLATHSLLPVIQAFTKSSGINVETRDISLASRILASFSDLLPEDQRVPDALMTALIVIVSRILRDSSVERCLPQENHLIETFGLDRSHEAFGVRVHVWCLACRE